MSDERQAFEQLHAIPSGAEWCEKRHIYIHKNYSGLVLHPINESWEAFCEGALWQASRQAVSVPEWIKCSDRLPDVLDVWIKMTDGSVVACWSKLDGDFYWNGGGSESYILENTVTHWKPRQQE
jgi:hypothetical protein